VALSEESPYRKAVAEGYPALLSTAAHVEPERFFNGLDVFDRETSAVYMDNCCHYTRTGNLLLADFIAKSILASPGPWKRAN